MEGNNHVHDSTTKTDHTETDLSRYLQKNEIKILENINKYIIKNSLIYFSNLLKKNIQDFGYNIQIKSLFDYNLNNIKYLNCVNSTDIIPFHHQCFVTFSSNFLSVIIDCLFGSNSAVVQASYKQNPITCSELLLNKNITNYILTSFSDAYRKKLCLDIQFINIKFFLNMQKSRLFSKEMFLVSCFDFYINNIKVYFSVLIPFAIIKKINITTRMGSNNEHVYKEKNILRNLALEDIYDLELNIVIRINDIFVQQNKVNLSVGDVLLIQNINKIIGFLDDQAIFYGEYKRFNKQLVIFIKEFINDVESKQIRNNLMSNIINDSNNTKRIHPEQNIPKNTHLNPNILSNKTVNNTSNGSQELLNNKNMILNSSIKMSVELGKAKIKIKDVLNLSKGSMLTLDKLIDEPLEIYLNDRIIAVGEIVVLENQYGIRVTHIHHSLHNLNVLS